MSVRPAREVAEAWALDELIMVQDIDRVAAAIEADRASLTTERDRLLGLWQSVSDQLAQLRHHEESKGGQTVGPPHWYVLLKVPSVRKELEWYAREALASPPPRAEPGEPPMRDSCGYPRKDPP